MTRAAIQGIPGAFSQIAAGQVFGDVDVVARPAFDDLIEAVVRGDAHVGMVPVENTLAGSVQRNLERIRQSGLEVVAETRVRIELCLIGKPGQDLKSVSTAASHPVALEQCRALFTARGIQGIAAYDTAGSVEQLMTNELPADAAVASRLAATLYGAEVLAAGIEDDPSNFTRFLAVKARGSTIPDPLNRAMVTDEADVAFQREGSEDGVERAVPVPKATISFVVPHEPGSLAVVVGGFARSGLNLTRIESWPIPGRPWEYRFFADLTGQDATRLEETVRAAAEIGGAHITIMGIYPSAEGMATAGLEPATPTM